MDAILNSDDVDLVMKQFFSFVDGDTLVSTQALGNQGRLLSRTARYAGKAMANVELYACWQGHIWEESLNAGFRYLRRIARQGGDGRSLPLSGIVRGFAETVGFLEENRPDLTIREDNLRCSSKRMRSAAQALWRSFSTPSGIMCR